VVWLAAGWHLQPRDIAGDVAGICGSMGVESKLGSGDRKSDYGDTRHIRSCPSLLLI
jgi:hypothetical protein